MNISLSEELHDYILGQVRQGGHVSVSEYIRSLVRRDRGENINPQAVPKPMPALRTANDAGRRIGMDL